MIRLCIVGREAERSGVGPGAMLGLYELRFVIRLWPVGAAARGARINEEYPPA
jgi:hypothetical protein